jgi:undecaprenyl-diphosphatase
VLVLVIVGTAGVLWLEKKRGTTILVLVASLGGLGMSSVLKESFARQRPDIVPHLARVFSSSFPSGHALMSAVVYLTLGVLVTRVVTQRSAKLYLLLVAMVLTGLVGFSRVYLGVHYPTDVLAGWTAGLVWATSCWLVSVYLARRGAIESEAST